jgi:hypothetical protein
MTGMNRLKPQDFDRMVRVSQKDLLESQRNADKSAAAMRPSSWMDRKVLFPLAAVGGLAVAAFAGVGVYGYAKNKLDDSSGALCKKVPGVELIANDACTVSVSSRVPMKPRDAANTDGIIGAVEYKLDSTSVIVGSLSEGTGTGLYIPVKAVPAESYKDTSLSINDPSGNNVSALNVFQAFYPLVSAGGEGAKDAEQFCYDEIDALMQAVRDDADLFAQPNFSQAIIEDPRLGFNRMDFAPYTATALPSTPRFEIVFTDASKELRCPNPT